MSRDANALLKKQISDQDETISRLKSQLGRLVDRLALVEHDVDRFKGKVGDDVKKIVEFMNKKGRSNV
tara:strand:+ start:70 stop:273 length:204 start_codon:yes stop_codon:yes gene_type:complete